MLSHTRWSFPPSLKLIRLSIAKLQRCWCGYVTWPCDLYLWPFDLWQWTNMAGHVVNPSTKFEDPAPIRSRSWLMSYDVRHRPPLTMRLEPLRMRYITWPVHKGKVFPNIWNPWTRFVYSLRNPHGSTINTNNNWVICQNSVRPCVKDECDVYASAKSRELSAGGRKELYFWNLRPRYAYLLYNFYGATMKIKGRLYNTCPMLKVFSSENL